MSARRMSKPTETPEPGSMLDNKITVGRFEIDTGRPLHAYDHTYADAFECTSFESGLNDHVAIIVKGRFPVRQDVVDSCLNNEVHAVMLMRVAQAIRWPADDTQRFALIYKRPAGNPLLQKHLRQREPLAEETLKFAVIRPIFLALLMISDRHLFHGNIRPDNIFLTNPENPEAVLGDCASSAPGACQPVIYESIERAMADPEGKGVGHSYDDVYALGATVAILLHGVNPLEGKSPDAIIEDRINRGSYAVMTDGLRLSPSYSELLRATLNDDPLQRWNLDQLAAWVEGTRTQPKQTSLVGKAQRALDFNGRQYIRARALAKDLHRAPSEAIALIQSGTLAKWLERALGDQTVTAAFSNAVARAEGGGRNAGYEDRLLTLVCMALDPQAPLRYRDLVVFPAGIGHKLAFAMLGDKPVQNLAEMLRERLPWLWLNQKDHPAGVQQELIQLMDQASKMITRRGLNHGVERCLYELCGDVPCLSDLFPAHYVTNSAALLHALDDVAEKNKDKRPMDRHVASFITTRDEKDKSGLIALVEGSDPVRRALGLITLFQQMQRRDDVPRLEHLCQWLVKDAELVAGRFKNIKLKNDTLKQIPKEAKAGNLNNLLLLIDSANLVRKDEREFANAAAQHQRYGREQEHIRNDLANNPFFGFDTGRQMAFFVSAFLAAIMVVCSFLMNFVQTGQ